MMLDGVANSILCVAIEIGIISRFAGLEAKENTETIDVLN